MISSEDVRRVTFEKAFQGYRRDDVDDYLKQVAQSMDELAAQNDDLQKKLVVLAQRIDQYRAEEDTLRTTMINAQRLGENVIREDKQKAAEIIRTANIKDEDREQSYRYFESLPVVITYTDGTTQDLTNAGGGITPGDGETVCQKSRIFDELRPLDEVASVTVGDIVLPVSAG